MLPEHISRAIHDYLPHLEGWTTPERGCEMAAAVYELGHPVAVSIGVFSGRSIIAMGFAMRQLTFGMVYGIDPYKVESATEGNGDEADKEWWAKKADLERMNGYAANQIWAHNLDQWVTLIRNASQNVSQLFPQIGVLEIDGNHSEEASCRDVELYLPRVVPGGYIFFDDTSWPTTQKAVGMMDARCELVNDTGEARTYRKR